MAKFKKGSFCTRSLVRKGPTLMKLSRQLYELSMPIGAFAWDPNACSRPMRADCFLIFLVCALSNIVVTTEVGSNNS